MAENQQDILHPLLDDGSLIEGVSNQVLVAVVISLIFIAALTYLMLRYVSSEVSSKTFTLKIKNEYRPLESSYKMNRKQCNLDINSTQICLAQYACSKLRFQWKQTVDIFFVVHALWRTGDMGHGLVLSAALFADRP
ncbi:unnamed protein product [Ranitomeya imitator]|uniref:ATP synthase F0 subunit 8 n=1 Tax=Ranitomeya imitator TaxID=111125 RepID=A0ABN9KVD6_9NEOB|nr:unnamed protein product [Ranitomeya imitator]